MRELVADFFDRASSCAIRMLAAAPRVWRARSSAGALSAGSDAAMAALVQRRLAGMRGVPVPGQIEMFG